MKLLHTLVAAAVLASPQVLAAEYKYQDNVYDVKLTKNAVSVKHCDDKNKCETSTAKIKELTERLTKRVAEYDKLLADKNKLADEVKKQAANSETHKATDPNTKIEYVMISLGDHFNLPVPAKDLEAGKTDFVNVALASNKKRYQGVLALLKAGKLPDGFETDDYGKISPYMELQNIVKFAKHL